ncbi:MAG: efflux RND transporter permease subunit, partial [Bacteroidaceae bacterium]
IIAMGMLVDNAIVVSDSILINMQKGMRKRVAIMRAASSTAMPLLAATVIAILTFLPIYFSPHITGELMSSLVIVIGVSLMFSWVFALTQTPFCVQEFVRRPRPNEITSAPFSSKIYMRFRVMLKWIIHRKYMTVAAMVVLLIVSAWSFKFIPKVFIPTLDKQYFTINMWLPEGTRIEKTDEIVQELSDYIRNYPQTETVTTSSGQTPPRYYLANSSFGPQSNYANILVKGVDSKKSRQLQAILNDSLSVKFPEAFIKVNKFDLSPSPEALIEARFLGPDAAVLDSLVEVAINVMRKNPKTANVRNEWGNMAMLVKPVYDPVKAGVLGISKASMMESVKSVNDGVTVGIYRDEDKKVPILLKSETNAKMDMNALENL